LLKSGEAESVGGGAPGGGPTPPGAGDKGLKGGAPGGGPTPAGAGDSGAVGKIGGAPGGDLTGGVGGSPGGGFIPERVGDNGGPLVGDLIAVGPGDKGGHGGSPAGGFMPAGTGDKRGAGAASAGRFTPEGAVAIGTEVETDRCGSTPGDPDAVCALEATTRRNLPGAGLCGFFFSANGPLSQRTTHWLFFWSKPTTRPRQSLSS